MQIKRLREDDTIVAQEIISVFMAEPGIDHEFPAKDHLNKWLKNENCYLLVATEENNVVGFVMAYRFPSFSTAENTAYLYDIEVLPAHRMKGIGRQLIKYLNDQLKIDDVNEMWLGTGVGNFPAQRLFTATGAQKEEETFYEYYYYLGSS